MVSIGTVFSPIGKKALLCGSGELGKEVAIELQRYGIEVVALDRYPNAPAMQVAHRSYVVLMLDGAKLREMRVIIMCPTAIGSCSESTIPGPIPQLRPQGTIISFMR